MDFVRRLVIRSLRERDKGESLVMLGASGREVAACDGKHHLLERPKCRNPVHLTAIDTLLSSVNTNREIRCALQRLSQDS